MEYRNKIFWCISLFLITFVINETLGLLILLGLLLGYLYMYRYPQKDKKIKEPYMNFVDYPCDVPIVSEQMPVSLNHQYIGRRNPKTFVDPIMPMPILSREREFTIPKVEKDVSFSPFSFTKEKEEKYLQDDLFRRTEMTMLQTRKMEERSKELKKYPKNTYVY